MTNKLPENTPLEGLPAYWQEQIRKLRSENHSMRTQRKELREQVEILSMRLADRALTN